MKKNQSTIAYNIKDKINELSKDSIHGSSFLTRKAINIVRLYLDEIKPSKIEMKTLTKIVQLIVQAQPTMALLINFSNRLLLFLDKIKEKDFSDEEKKQTILNFLELFNQSIETGEKRICQNAVDLLKSISPIATFSSSGTIQHTLELLHKKNNSLLVYCPESRPKNEGILLAKSLAENNIDVSVMTDATLFSIIKKVNALIIGADAITEKGVINKIGSYPLVKLATQQKIPVYCLFHSYKLIPPNFNLGNEPKKPATDILEKEQENITVINFYFDSTPLNYFTGFITDKGFFQTKELMKKIQNQDIHSSLKNK